MQESVISRNIVLYDTGTLDGPGKSTTVSDMSGGSNDSSRGQSPTFPSHQQIDQASLRSKESHDANAAAQAIDPSDEVSNDLYAASRYTIIELSSISATASAFPESFGLSISSKGKWVVAYSSGALYVIFAQRLASSQDCCRAFRLRRKPLTVVINDVGNFAILCNAYKVDVYKCGDGSIDFLSSPIVKLQTIQLSSEARAIALSARGELIAAGSDHGVEIVGLGLPKGSDRRQIQSGPVESLSFSEDQKSLLITGSARRTRSTTLLSISISFEQTMMMEEADADQSVPVAKLWISQLIFPEQLQARQSVFLPDPTNGQASELLSYDRAADEVGIYDTVMKRFTGRTLAKPENGIWHGAGRYEDTLPGVSSTGCRIAVAVRLDEASQICFFRTPSEWRDEDGTLLQNPIIGHIRIDTHPSGTSESLISLRWIEKNAGPPTKLLALVGTVARSMPEDMEAASGAASGKILMFDLEVQEAEGDHVPSRILIDLDQYPFSEVLTEEEVGLQQEIDLVRRRTQVQRTQQSQRNRPSQRQQDVLSTPPPRLRRAMSSSSHGSNTGGLQDVDLHSSRFPRRRSFSSTSDTGEEGEAASAFAMDEPYSQTSPRPQFMLHRAATVAQNAPTTRTHLRAEPNRPLEYRRADGLREIPHESDADNWVPPPPPYSAKPDAPGPNAMSLPIQTIPGLAERVLQGSHVQRNHNPSPHGMRSRVSQVLSGIQIPSLVPPRPQAQPRYADPNRIPGPPPNVSIGSAHPQRSPPAFPSTADSSRVTSHRITRRPLSTNATLPLRSSPSTPGLVNHALEMSAMPGTPQTMSVSVNRDSTAASARRSRMHGAERLVIPRTTSFSTPVTPMVQNTSQHVPTTASAGPTSHPHIPRSNAVDEGISVSPLAQSINSSPRQAISTDPTLSISVLPLDQQTSMQHRAESYSRYPHEPRIAPMSTSHLDYYSQQNSPETSSRRQHWWHGAENDSHRLAASESSTPIGVGRHNTSSSEKLEVKEKCIIM